MSQKEIYWIHKNIMSYIEDFRNRNWEYFFLHGGCYIFAKILQNKFWWHIFSNIDHCVLKKEWLYYDITGEVKDWRIKYSLIDPMQALRYTLLYNFE